MNELDQQTPQSPDAERAVLGSILINNTAYFRVAPIIASDSFHVERHQKIYIAIGHVLRRGAGVDILSLKEYLASAGELDAMGGYAFVSSLVDSIPNIANVERYAHIVAERARERQILISCHTGMQRVLAHEGETAEEIAGDLITELTRTAVPASRESKPLEERIAAVHERNDQRVARGEEQGIATSFAQLDERSAIRPTLIVVGGPSGHGKSAFLLNLWLGLMRKANDGASAFYSFEMTDQEITDRLTAIITSIPHKAIRAWKWLDEEQKEIIASVRKHLKRQPHRMFFADRLRTIDDIYTDCRKLKATHDLKAIFIDYMQLIRGLAGRSREEEMAQVSAQLLEIAIEMRIAVICSSQVNKDREKRSTGRLSQQDLKYAQAIGDSARVVLLLQRPWYDDKSNTELCPGKTLFQIEKNSEGTTGDYEMHFDQVRQKFVEGSCKEAGCGTAALTTRQLFQSA
jgi:replicative DNA helicase